MSVILIMKTPHTHYANLQITENASPEVVKGAYKYLSQKWHPDKNPDNRAEAERIFRVVNEAYAALSDPQRRKEHDLWIRAERENTARTTSENQRRSAPISADTPLLQMHQKSGFITRAWLMLLFTTALVMVLGIFPFQLFFGEFKWSYLGVLAFWLGVGHYAYVRLFHPEIVADEKLEETVRQHREAVPRQKATKIGWIVCLGSWPISVTAMMISGHPFDIAGVMSLLIAPALGLLGWSIAGLYLRATRQI